MISGRATWRLAGQAPALNIGGAQLYVPAIWSIVELYFDRIRRDLHDVVDEIVVDANVVVLFVQVEELRSLTRI